MRARPPMVGARVGVAMQRELVQPAPNHEGLAMHATVHQVHHGFDEDVQPGQETNCWVTKTKLAAWAH